MMAIVRSVLLACAFALARGEEATEALSLLQRRAAIVKAPALQNRVQNFSRGQGPDPFDRGAGGASPEGEEEVIVWGHAGPEVAKSPLSRLAKESTESDESGHPSVPEVSGPSEHPRKEERRESEEERRSEAAHAAPTRTSDAVASMLLAMTVFQISLFYMVNYPDTSVKFFTWTMISTTVSILCAVFIWSSTSAVHSEWVGASDEPSAHFFRRFGNQKDLGKARRAEVVGFSTAPILKFIVVYVVFNVLLPRLWRYRIALEAYATLGAHILGFAAAEVLSMLGGTAPWNTSWQLSLCFAILTCVMLFLLNWTTTYVRKKFLAGMVAEGNNQNQLNHFDQVCQHAEHELVAFAVGLLITLSIQFMITGELPNFHGNPYGKTAVETAHMFLASFVLAVLSVVIIAYSSDMMQSVSRDFLLRVIHTIEECASFSFGWCFLFSCRCLYWSATGDYGLFEGDQMTARVVQALGLTLFTILVILALKGLGDRGIIGFEGIRARALMSGFGLMLGLSWEGAFDQAIKALTLERDFAKDSLVIQHGMGLGVCGVILPAWGLYILPEAVAVARKMGMSFAGRGSLRRANRSMAQPDVNGLCEADEGDIIASGQPQHGATGR